MKYQIRLCVGLEKHEKLSVSRVFFPLLPIRLHLFLLCLLNKRWQMSAPSLIHNCFETELAGVFKVQPGSVVEPTEYIFDRMEKCVGECKFEVMCLRKMDRGWSDRDGAHVEREQAG